jgi:flagellar biosynthesis protein FlhF
MQIKRFEAKDMQEALRQVREVMGPEAVILSTKTLKHPAQRSRGYSQPGVEIVAAVERPANPCPGPTPASFHSFSPPAIKEREEAQEEEKIVEKIRSIGISPEFVTRLVEEVHSLRKELREWSLLETYRGFLRWKLMEQVEVTVSSGKGMRIWSFIGPTGVGKTTTLVKLAAHLSLTVTQKITLVTVDTYRIGAVEQLKAYAQILRLPLEIALHREDLKEIIERNRHQDLLLIDTAGRSPYPPGQMEELRDFLTVHPQIENHLLLSATMKDRDLEKAGRNFSSLVPVTSYIFTKIDETEEYTPLLNQLIRSKRPLSYLTTGQRVPEDFELASKVRMANLVLSQIQWN